jgi:hypothetical protein
VISSLVLAIALAGPGQGPAETLIQAPAASWWVCVVEYERRWYYSDVFAGDGPGSVYEAVFARYVEDDLTGHNRVAGCWQEPTREAAAARLKQEMTAHEGRAEPTGWAP